MTRETVSPPVEDEAVLRCAHELVARGSLELSSHRPEDARAIAELLPPGTAVYVPSVARDTLEHTLAMLVAIRNAGLYPVPHLAARRMTSRAAAKDFLTSAVARAGVRKVLLIGGDEPRARGPYPDGEAVLADGLLVECGVPAIALPGYPDGHPRISGEVLAADLAKKLALAREQELRPHIVTQFCFAPARIVEYCADLADRAPGVPVYCGLAGPANPVTLFKYAQRCGVSASLRAIRTQGAAAARLLTHADPRDQLLAIAKGVLERSLAHVVGVHLYSFGGVARTAVWMRDWRGESASHPLAGRAGS